MSSFKDLALNITEQEYRDLDALSYSLLSKYEKVGFSGLDKLYEKEESPSLTWGQLVDTLITDKEHFDDKFVVVDIPKVSDKITEIVDNMINNGNADYYFDDDKIRIYLNRYDYQTNWKDETRLYKFKILSNDYYTVKTSIGNREVISTEDYQDAVYCAEKLRERFPHVLVNTSFDDLEVFYQLKFKVNLHGIDYKFMPDVTFINHDKKEIYLVDIKTSGYPEYEFYKAYIKFNYQLQSRLYTRGIKEIISHSKQFRDYTIMPFRFFVINRETQIPMEWECRHCFAVGDIIMGKKEDIILRDPEDIGKELHDYLTNKPKVPNDVKENEANDLNWFINNKM